jgi:hypothetical protein
MQVFRALCYLRPRYRRLRDIYTQAGHNQFLIMLLGANYENCSAILERIKREFLIAAGNKVST